MDARIGQTASLAAGAALGIALVLSGERGPARAVAEALPVEDAARFERPAESAPHHRVLTADTDAHQLLSGTLSCADLQRDACAVLLSDEAPLPGLACVKLAEGPFVLTDAAGSMLLGLAYGAEGAPLVPVSGLASSVTHNLEHRSGMRFFIPAGSALYGVSAGSGARHAPLPCKRAGEGERLTWSGFRPY